MFKRCQMYKDSELEQKGKAIGPLDVWSEDSEEESAIGFQDIANFFPYLHNLDFLMPSPFDFTLQRFPQNMGIGEDMHLLMNVKNHQK